MLDSMTDWLVTDYSPGYIAVGLVHFQIPALAAALTDLDGYDHGDKYVFAADRRDQVAAILATAERILNRARELEDAEAVQYGLVRGEDLPRGGHPLGRQAGTVPGGTVYSDELGDGTVTIYDRS
jgi:hypothetical protein